MTRGRTSILILGCIGTFLLLFGNAVAEVTEASTVSEKPDSQKASTPQEATTILTTSSIHQNQSVAETGGRNIELTDRKTRNEEDGSHDSVSGKDASENVEKSNVSRNGSDTTRATSAKSNDESEGGSSDGNRKPRYDEIAAESSGKSTSTKVISEEALRLSSTNELTVTTAKLAFNDSKQDSKRNSGNATLQEFSNHEGTSDTTVSPSTEGKIVDEKLSANLVKTSESKHVEGQSSVKYEEKRNVTAISKQDATTVKSIGGDLSSMYSKSVTEDIKFDEKKDKAMKSDKEIVSKSESRKNKDVISADLKVEDHELENGRDRELTTARGIQREDSSGSKKNVHDFGTTASEVLDLERIDEKGHEGTISLINDTYVNYNHVYRTLSEKDPKASSGNHSVDAEESRGKNDPKEEVEVVENVSHQPTLRIVSTTNDTAKNDSHLNELDNQTAAVYVERKEKAGNENRHEQNSFAINTTIESTDGTEERKSIGKPESQVKLPETTTPSMRLEGHASSFIGEATSSPVPQGRTIGFSRVNEFPSIEVKSTAPIKIDGRVDASSVTPSLRNSSSTERIDQRPYPYLKSNRESLQMTTESSSKLENEGVTEETSAYENTIGRGESEKKFVVTEPSVVIENSIQQQKLDKKNINKSANSTTETPSSLTPVTVIPTVSAVVGPTNETFPERFNNSVSEAAKVRGSGSNDNDVPGAKEAEKATAVRGEGYDVTGNGITEVSLTPDGKEVKSHSGETTESLSTLRSTKMPNTSKTIPPNTDIQMEPEEAMMIRSTLVVTESTIVPLNKDGATEANTSTTSTTSAAEISTAAVVSDNFTESTTKANVTSPPPQSSSNINRTTESPSATLNPDESRIPTTTSIEFEFVSLTEAVSSANNTTERNIEGRTFEAQTMSSNTTAIRDLSGNSTDDVAITTTKSEEKFTELPITTEDGASTTDQASIVVQRNNETVEARDPPVTQTASEDRGNRTELTKYSEVTADLTSVTAGASGSLTETPSESKDSSFDANVTETSAPGAIELSPKSGVTTNATKGPSVPFATTVETRTLWSTPSIPFTELPDEETTENIQILSSDEITLLVKIVIEGTLHEVCPRLQDLRKALADVLTNGMDRLVLPKQIIIHQNPCPEPANSSLTSMDGSLTSILVYVIDEDGKFDVAMTKILPSLYKVSANLPVRIHKFLLVPEADSGNAIAVVVVSSVAFICLVLLAGLLFIMRKRQTRFNYGERCRPVSLDAYSLDSVSAYNSVRRKGAVRSSKRSYGNPTFEDSSAIPSHPLNFAGLSSFCNDVNAINEEFAGIPQVSGKIDELPPGAEVKNRYANVIPLPETRVQLQKLNNDASTEYINASYVRGPKNATKYYIACQAPIESTVTDFWRMIWEQQCKVIIMLTDLVENGVEKCTEYIPPSEVTDCHRLYGDFQVTLKKREAKEKYAISTLQLKNLEHNTFREVFHIWYLWPVSGVQSDGTGLIAVLLEARALQRGGPGPIVVHCSPGTGRTGTLIALDLGIRQYEITRTVDVPRVVYTIRRDRAGAVQTKEQYAFIYKALNLYATKLAGGVLEST